MANITAYITRDRIEAWNRIVNEVAGTRLYNRFALQKERKEEDRWTFIGFYPIRLCYKAQEGERFYIKKIKKNLWLYWANPEGEEQERWLLTEMAERFFL